MIAEELRKHDEWIASQKCAGGVAIKEFRRISSWVSVEMIAHLGVTVLLDNLGSGNNLGSTVTEVTEDIGQHLEHQAFMAYMEAVDERYFKKMREYYLNDPVRRYDKKVYALQRALEKHAEMEWNWMKPEDHVRLGSLILSRIMILKVNAETDEGLFEIRTPEWNDPNKKQKKSKAHKDARCIGYSVSGLYYRDQLQKAADYSQWKPMPMVCKPLPWELGDDGEILRGGYMTKMPGIAGDLIHNNKGSQPSQLVLDAIKRLQNTGYKVNTYILDLQKELITKTWEIGSWRSYEALSYEDEHKPIYDSDWLDSLDTDSEEYKKAMLDLMKYYHSQKVEEKKAANPRRTVVLGDEFRNEAAFYTPWYLDTRGRCYPVVEGLSPQGPDWQKAMLRSAVAVPVNDDTRKDLLISIATAGAFDNVDKKDFFERLQWAEAFVQTNECRAMVDDPVTYKFWHDADEPWQFLAFCKEYFDIFVDRVKDTCDVFVFRDATNSGLQILAGLMRDPKSAHYTNVLPTDEPQDAYRLVAETAKELMRTDWWMTSQFDKRSKDIAKKNRTRPADEQIEDRGETFEFEIDVLNRNHTKTQVMTTLYNSSPLTRRDNILGALKKKNQVELHPGDKGIVVKACIESMSKEFEVALELNEWFQTVAIAAMEAGKEHLKWISPSGMFVVNEYREPLYSRVNTYAAGGGHYAQLMHNSGGQVYLQTGYGDVKASKVKSSTSANYIHSLDAAIVHLSVLDTPEEVPVFTVHDCWAMVPGTVSTVIPLARKAFLNVVTSNPLEGLLEENELDDQIEIPPQGDAPIEECLNSPYMYS